MWDARNTRLSQERGKRNAQNDEEGSFQDVSCAPEVHETKMQSRLQQIERISRKTKFLDYQMGLFSKEIQIIEVEFGVELKIRA